MTRFIHHPFMGSGVVVSTVASRGEGSGTGPFLYSVPLMHVRFPLGFSGFLPQSKGMQIK